MIFFLKRLLVCHGNREPIEAVGHGDVRVDTNLSESA
jgi:hypothetical protein